MSELIHPELSYAVRGAMLEVYNALGPQLKEAYYRDAIAIELEERGIVCVREKGFEVFYRDERVGRYYVDIWVEGGKILLELKVAPQIEALHKAQAISYLKVTDADLAIVGNYGAASFEDIRLPNFLRKARPELHWQAQAETVPAHCLYPKLVSVIQQACHRIHHELGSGFFHQIYRRAAMIELRRSGLSFDYIKQLPISYKGRELGQQHVRIIVIEGKIALAAFAVKDTQDALQEQFKAYLRRLKLQLGVFANFHGIQPMITYFRV